MKTAKIVLITLAFAVPVLLNAQERTTTPAQSKGKTTERESLTPLQVTRKYSRIKGSRKIDVIPVKQTDGIKTGTVIAYGHLIPPPYKVEAIGEKILINGIQVVPSLVAERESKPAKMSPKKKEFSTNAWNLQQEVKKRYYTQILFKDKDKLKSEILAYVKSQSVIEDAYWGEQTLFLKYVGDIGYSTMIEFRGTTQEKPWPSRKKEASEAAVQYITKGIESGCILIDSDGGTSPGCGDKKIVSEIMQNSNLSKDEKIERLAKWGNYDVALDITENYNPQEWNDAGAIK